MGRDSAISLPLDETGIFGEGWSQYNGEYRENPVVEKSSYRDFLEQGERFRKSPKEFISLVDLPAEERCILPEKNEAMEWYSSIESSQNSNNEFSSMAVSESLSSYILPSVSFAISFVIILTLLIVPISSIPASELGTMAFIALLFACLGTLTFYTRVRVVRSWRNKQTKYLA